MKLKLLALSIFVVLALTAYQKYSEYSSLKSIDSYESCVSAKGSVIQESYPSTCVTRLGTRFTQQYFGILPILNSNGWKTFRSKNGYEFSFPSDIEIDDSLYGDDHTENITLIFRQGESVYYLTTVAAGRDGPQTDKIMNENIFLDGRVFNKRTWIENGKPILISVMPDSGTPFNHIEITVPPGNSKEYLDIIDQILSTFKLTD